MARPTRCRRICNEPDYTFFSPNGTDCKEQVSLALDEYEVIRLIDYDGKTHEQAAKLMDISRTTVTEVYERARAKIADCIVNGKALFIGGGNYYFCNGSVGHACGKRCRMHEMSNFSIVKGDIDMRVAVTYDNGSIFQHFGHTEQFKIYDIDDGKIVDTKVVSTMGEGHGALAGFLTRSGVDALICGGIGGGAKTALKEAGIKLYGGVAGEADVAVNALIKSSLNYNPDVHCDHHDNGEEHTCGNHGCGTHTCGH